MRKIILFAAILMIAFLASCSFEESMEARIKELIPDEVDKFALSYMWMIREARFDEAEALLGKELQSPEAKQTLRMLQSVVNGGSVESTEIVNFKVLEMFTNETTRYLLEYYVQYNIPQLSDDRKVQQPEGEIEAQAGTDINPATDGKLHQIITVAIDKSQGALSIVGFYVRTIPKSAKELYGFDLVYADLSRQAFLVLWILVPLFSIYVFVLCLRTKVKKKFLWLIFIVIGVGKLTMNWSTGQLTTHPLSVQLLGISYLRTGLYGPWLFSTSWPLGAMMFFLKWKKLKALPLEDKLEPDLSIPRSDEEVPPDESTESMKDNAAENTLESGEPRENP